MKNLILTISFIAFSMSYGMEEDGYGKNLEEFLSEKEKFKNFDELTSKINNLPSDISDNIFKFFNPIYFAKRLDYLPLEIHEKILKHFLYPILKNLKEDGNNLEIICKILNFLSTFISKNINMRYYIQYEELLTDIFGKYLIKFYKGNESVLTDMLISLCVKKNINKTDLNAILVLLKAGADLNKVDRSEETALSCAANHQNWQVLKYLLDYLNRFDQDVQVKILSSLNFKFGSIFLHWCHDFGYNKAVELFLNHLKQFDQQSQMTILEIENFSITPFIAAYDYNNEKVIELFLNHIIDFSQNDQIKIMSRKNYDVGKEEGLSFVLLSFKKKIAQLILNQISKFDQETQILLINRIFRDLTAYPNDIIELVLSFINRFDETVQMMIINKKHDYRVNSPLVYVLAQNINNYEPETVLKHSVTLNKVDCIELILKHISKFDLNAQIEILNSKDKNCNTILEIAKRFGNTKIIALFNKAIENLSPI